MTYALEIKGLRKNLFHWGRSVARCGFNGRRRRFFMHCLVLMVPGNQRRLVLLLH